MPLSHGAVGSGGPPKEGVLLKKPHIHSVMSDAIGSQAGVMIVREKNRNSAVSARVAFSMAMIF